MSVVVSDTSPIRALHHLDKLQLLQTFYGTVLVPSAVARELASPHGPSDTVDVVRFPFLVIRTPADSTEVQRLRLTLDVGEAEAIALALEVKAELLLIDEMAGRRAATAARLPHIGVLGILTRAKREGLIADVRSRVDRLRSETRFFVSDRLYRELLRDLGE